MHGRLKVKTSAVLQAEKRKKEASLVKNYLIVTKKIFFKRKNGEYDNEMLLLTSKILAKNSDFYTLWNIRKEAFLLLKENPDPAPHQNFITSELTFLQQCLMTNPKSYSVWHHRMWLINNSNIVDLEHELDLCNQFLSRDERNFHCWDYRRYIGRKLKISPEREFKFTTEKLEANFSNYSAWHYRGQIISKRYPYVVSETNCDIQPAILESELEFVKQALFTDPKDTSAWIYYRFILGKGDRSQQINYLYYNRKTGEFWIMFSKPILVSEFKCSVRMNGVPVHFNWRPIIINPPSKVARMFISDELRNIKTFEEHVFQSNDINDPDGRVHQAEVQNHFNIGCGRPAPLPYRWNLPSIAVYRPEEEVPTSGFIKMVLNCPECDELSIDSPQNVYFYQRPDVFNEWTVSKFRLPQKMIEKEKSEFLADLSDVDLFPDHQNLPLNILLSKMDLLTGGFREVMPPNPNTYCRANHTKWLESFLYYNDIITGDPYRTSRHVYYRECRLTEIMLMTRQQHAEMYASLTIRVIPSCPFSGFYLQHPQHLSILSRLSLEGLGLTTVDFPGWVYLRCLEKLILDNNLLTSLEGLQKIPRLTHLSVSSNLLNTASAYEPIRSCHLLVRIISTGNEVICRISRRKYSGDGRLVRFECAKAGSPVVFPLYSTQTAGGTVDTLSPPARGGRAILKRGVSLKTLCCV